MRYPVSEAVCKKCSACHRVERNIDYSPIPWDQQYYQCIAGMEAFCEEREMEREAEGRPGSYLYALMEGGGITD